MDLSFTDEQQAARALAAQIFAGHCTDARLREVEAGAERYDPALWAELGRSGLLGFGIPGTDGGNGGGMIELCLLLEEAGRAVAPVPLWASLVAASAVARFGSAEQRARLLPGALDGSAALTLSVDPSLVPNAARAAAIVVVGDAEVTLLDPATATIEPLAEPGKEPLSAVTGGTAEPLASGAEAVAWVLDRARTAVASWQTGLCDGAVRLTAAYLSQREQFDKPIATFQAVQQRIADAYIDVEVMRWTMWQAAYRLDAGDDATEEVAIAKYWASQGAGSALAAAQHLHGGMGVDMDYPLHRYTFASRQAELALGSAREHLARLGDLIAEGAR